MILPYLFGSYLLASYLFAFDHAYAWMKAVHDPILPSLIGSDLIRIPCRIPRRFAASRIPAESPGRISRPNPGRIPGRISDRISGRIPVAYLRIPPVRLDPRSGRPTSTQTLARLSLMIFTQKVARLGLTFTQKVARLRSDFHPKGCSTRSDFRPNGCSSRSDLRPNGCSSRSDFRPKGCSTRSDFL